jgi:hypothetical protein
MGVRSARILGVFGSAWAARRRPAIDHLAGYYRTLAGPATRARPLRASHRSHGFGGDGTAHNGGRFLHPARAVAVKQLSDLLREP